MRGRLLDFLLPPSCLICHKAVVTSGMVCAECFQQLSFLVPPYCYSCGIPFSSDKEAGYNHLCLTCDELPFPWKRYYGLFGYNKAIKKLILALKYGDQQNSIPFFAKMMLNMIRDDFQYIHLIIPVPLHKKRLRQRKYNQSALLAWQLGKLTNIRVIPDMLVRNQKTPMLGRFSREERELYLKNAFCINPAYKEYIIDKTILLIDDVMTTGCTLSECTKILLKSRAKEVLVSTVAKVI